MGGAWGCLRAHIQRENDRLEEDGGFDASEIIVRIEYRRERGTGPWRARERRKQPREKARETAAQKSARKGREWGRVSYRTDGVRHMLVACVTVFVNACTSGAALAATHESLHCSKATLWHLPRYSALWRAGTVQI
eukprot:2648269-Pleurochrysis_carterae.AAC.2